MSSETREEEIRLSGDWSIFSIAEKMPFLLERLTALATGAGKPAVIDFGAVDTIDVSGWQLLVLWLRRCRQLGLSPIMANVSDDHRRRLDLLGFAGEFTFREN